jgi:hypothetical protein
VSTRASSAHHVTGRSRWSHRLTPAWVRIRTGAIPRLHPTVSPTTLWRRCGAQAEAAEKAREEEASRRYQQEVLKLQEMLESMRCEVEAAQQHLAGASRHMGRTVARKLRLRVWRASSAQGRRDECSGLT